MASRHAERAIILSVCFRPDVSILKCLSCKPKADSSGWVSLPLENVSTLPGKLCPATSVRINVSKFTMNLKSERLSSQR